jgi:uncharacterized protein (TIGR02246 family)
MRYLAIAAVMLGLAATSGCTPAGDDAASTASSSSAQDKQALDELRSSYASAWDSGNASAIADLYSADAMAFPGNQPTVTGRDAILKYNEDFFAQYKPGKMDLTPEETRIMGDWAFDRGTYHMTATAKSGDQAMEARGRYLVILRKQADGSWKVSRDFDNTDSAAPAQ